jgi:hypothetical protein
MVVRDWGVPVGSIVGEDDDFDLVRLYKIHGPSVDHNPAEMPAHTRLKPTSNRITLTFIYRSLRSSRRSIRDSCKNKVRKVVSMYNTSEK